MVTKRCTECDKWFDAKGKSVTCGSITCRKIRKSKVRSKWSKRTDVKGRLREYQSTYMREYLSDPEKKRKFLDQQKEYRGRPEIKAHRRITKRLRKKRHGQEEE